MAIESVNPDLVAGGSGEGRIGAFVAGWLDSAGLEVSVVEPVSGRPSVVGVARGSDDGPSLMLNAHMDTVGAGGMAAPFSPEVRDGRIYGRGALDMKASLAAIMLAGQTCVSKRLRGDVLVCAVADEEVASFGTEAVLSQFRADYGIVTEPTELSLCLAHKGFAWLEVETHGVAAHGSRADLGVDAIAHIGRVLTGVLELNERLRSGPRHGLLGTGSTHASLIAGGQEMSTYPATCVARFERRTVPGENGANVLREIEELIGSERATARVTLERPPSELAPDHPLVTTLDRLADHPPLIGVAYWMDMALMNAAGIPTAAFGPSGEGEHADVEWVDVESVRRCVDVYTIAAESLCSGN